MTMSVDVFPRIDISVFFSRQISVWF